ncbi:MAG: PspA-associated protein PspAB [Dehalococcoidia bacterium]
MSFLSSFFKSKKNDAHILQSILRIENIQINQNNNLPVLSSAILLSPSDDAFFNTFSVSVNQIARKIPNISKVNVIETDDHGTKWVIFSSRSFENLISITDEFSKIIAAQDLGDRMIAAIFKSNLTEQKCYWICNYRSSKFYPFVPQENQTRNSELEMTLGHTLSKLGIPVELHEKWYPVWDAPF